MLLRNVTSRIGMVAAGGATTPTNSNIKTLYHAFGALLFRSSGAPCSESLAKAIAIIPMSFRVRPAPMRCEFRDRPRFLDI